MPKSQLRFEPSAVSLPGELAPLYPGNPKLLLVRCMPVSTHTPAVILMHNHDLNGTTPSQGLELSPKVKHY